MRKYREKYQTGGATMVDLAAQRKFYTDYINSPNYLARLKKQGYTNTSQVIRDRLKNAKTMQAAEFPSVETQYFRESNFIPVNSAELKQEGLPLDITLAHEFSHGIGALEPSAPENKNLGLNQNEVNQFVKRNKLSSITPKSGDYPLQQELNIYHDKKASENKADIDSLRFKLKQDKIYDTGTQKFDKNYLKKAKQKYSKDETINRMFQNFSDDDLIYLMNNIAASQVQNNPMAQMGGSMNKSVMGYRRDSPYKNDPFIDIFTPGGLIDMSNTDKDLIGIDEYGNKKKMKARTKNPYQFEGQTVREIPMQQGGSIRNPYMQQGGIQDLYNYLFEEDEPQGEEPLQTTAPDTEEVDARTAELDRREQELAQKEEYNQAMMLAMQNGENPFEMQQRQIAGQGQAPTGFRSFGSYEEGRNALENQLELYKSGKTKNPVKGTTSLLDAMSVYAPSSDGNDPANYAHFIARKLGVSANTPIYKIDTKKWADAIQQMEGNKRGNNPGNLRF